MTSSWGEHIPLRTELRVVGVFIKSAINAGNSIVSQISWQQTPIEKLQDTLHVYYFLCHSYAGGFTTCFYTTGPLGCFIYDTIHERLGVTNYQQIDFLLKRFSMLTGKKSSRQRIIGAVRSESTNDNWLPFTTGQKPESQSGSHNLHEWGRTLQIHYGSTGKYSNDTMLEYVPHSSKDLE